ncbi:hypothetical protein VKT23_002266 [Stygiomarasmius scandens]|uniref:Uncharacterized protein n=1 Tax=Marasmiellus scandens TaxID=2682957 RepID=A0ABR1K1G4_9AGAR
MPSLLPCDDLRLPELKSLLVQGPFHPTAPIHLALTHTAQNEHYTTLFLSAAKIENLLKDYNDLQLNSQSGHGITSEVSSRIKMVYPPTPAHLSVLLSLFYIPSLSDAGSCHPQVTLNAIPSLIILHELSAFFLPQIESEPTSHPWTLASYLTLVTRTFSMISRWSKALREPETTMVLFDSQLDHLKLPILKFPAAPYERFRVQEKTARTEDVGLFLRKYFEWIIIAESGQLFQLEKLIQPLTSYQRTS